MSLATRHKQAVVIFIFYNSLQQGAYMFAITKNLLAKKTSSCAFASKSKIKYLFMFAVLSCFIISCISTSTSKVKDCNKQYPKKDERSLYSKCVFEKNKKKNNKQQEEDDGAADIIKIYTSTDSSDDKTNKKASEKLYPN